MGKQNEKGISTRSKVLVVTGVVTMVIGGLLEEGVIFGYGNGLIAPVVAELLGL